MVNKITYSILLVVVLFFMGCDSIADPDPVPDTTTPVSYELVWEDNFDLGTLDDTYWDYDLGYGGDGWGNDEWQNYTNSPENITVEDGNMVISALCPTGIPGKRDGSVTSARVKTQNKVSFKFGKIQARIKAPTGTGMWPAFWMLGNSFETAGWPYCGEIDIMEASPLLHGNSTAMCTMHWWDDINDVHQYYGTTYDLNESLSDDYHVYEVEWNEQRVVGKVDNITYFTKIIDPITMSEFLQNFFLIFDVAVGGNLGGAPDDTTVWPQQMYVDWVKVYQDEEDLIPIESYGIFTDETPVDDALEIGVNADIYVWESTLVGGTIPPYEGANVISWSSAGAGWFGGGISSTMPIDLSTFEEGNLKFMIKMPANVTFKIGIIDAQDKENYVEFPAGQIAYGLVRDNEWGQAIIPVSELKGNVNLQMLTYEFAILEENGASCEFAIDDIYYDGGGTTQSDATLSDLQVDGTTVSGFDSNLLDYNVELPEGTSVVPTVTATTTDPAASYVVNDATALPGTTTVVVTGVDSLTTLTYNVNFSLASSVPTVAAPDPIQNAADVISIYSDTYTDLAGTNFNPGWGQTTIVTFEDIGGNEMMKYDVFNYQGTELVAAQDLSGMDYMHVDMWTSDATVVKVTPISSTTGEFLVSLVPINSGLWNSYDIPVGDFTGVSMADIFQLKFDCQDGATPSTVYLDNIYFYSNTLSTAAGIYSESHTTTMIPYTQIINSADWSGNSAVPDEVSTAVTPLDGTYVLSVTYETGGTGWGGVAFDFGSADISSYSNLILSIDTSNMPTLAHFGIKLEDNSTGNTEVDLLTYTPVVAGNWATYEIPLTDFPAANLADLKYLGLWNPKDAGDVLLFDTLYFDDIYLGQ